MIRALWNLAVAFYYSRRYRVWCSPVDGLIGTHSEDLDHTALYGVSRCRTCRRPIERG